MEFDELPGFRFHPTEEELLDFYLTKTVLGQDTADIIGFLNIYNHEPWDLPGTATVILSIICLSNSLFYFLGACYIRENVFPSISQLLIYLEGCCGVVHGRFHVQISCTGLSRACVQE